MITVYSRNRAFKGSAAADWKSLFAAPTYHIHPDKMPENWHSRLPIQHRNLNVNTE